MTSLYSEMHPVRYTVPKYVEYWAEQEDALICRTDEDLNKIDQFIDLEESVWIASKVDKSILCSAIQLNWRGFGVRRGTMFMEQGHPSHPNRYGWWIGFTTAGNGTPAYIFPVQAFFEAHLQDKYFAEKMASVIVESVIF